MIAPPWIEYPSYPPGDYFWREAGEPWFQYVWRPYYDSLSPLEQQQYLLQWNVPQVWRTFYFDEEYQRWLDSVDEE